MNNVGNRTRPKGDIDCDYQPLAFENLPRRKGPRPEALPGPLHIQCDGYGDGKYLDELAAAVFSWPYVERVPQLPNPSDILPIRLEGAAAKSDVVAFISPREFARILLGAPTIYLALPLACAHWTMVRGWAEPHYLCSYGLMPAGTVVVYTPRDQGELFICYSLFFCAYSAACKLSN